MLLGLLCSRSMASIGMFLFGVNALRDVHPREWLKQRWWLIGLIWIALYAISWFWSSNKEEWNAHFQVKLPFLFLPLAFTWLDPWSPRQLRVFTIIFSGMMMIGVLYSLSFMIRDPDTYLTGYKYSHTLPTPAYNDHIAFSTCIAVCIAWCAYSWRYWNSRLSKALLVAVMLLLGIYLHVLAAKSGLLAFYLFLCCYIIYQLASNWKRALLMLMIVGLGGTIAYTFIPTLRERIDYTMYSYDRYKLGERSGLYSDVGRIISYNLALKLIEKHPLTGTGAGDVLDEMSREYPKYYPQVSQDQYLYPHNQFLTTAVAAGIPAALALIWWLCIPLVKIRRNREGFFFLAFWLMLLIPLLVDPFLEVQSGVFVYLFFFLMQRSVCFPPNGLPAIQPSR